MSEKEKKIMETFGKVIPDLSETEKERLLAFGEGIAFKNEQLKAEQEAQIQLVLFFRENEVLQTDTYRQPPFPRVADQTPRGTSHLAIYPQT